MSLRNRLSFATEPLYLIDGSAFVYRGFYAFQNMTRSDGLATNALYVVARLMLKLLREENPKHFSFVLDGKGPTFRKHLFPEYKAQRSATPEALIAQIAPLLQLLEYLGIPLLVAKSFEADDYIASLAARFQHERPIVIVGADKDLRQCLTPSVTLWDPSGKNEKITTYHDFIEETGIAPSSWADYQALIGDSSDNIPGVPQVGPKTGIEIMRQFPTLEEVFAGLGTLPQKMQAKLAGMEEKCQLYRELTRLRTDVCAEITLEQLTIQSPQFQLLHAFLQEYELRSLMKEVDSMQRTGFFGSPPLQQKQETKQTHSAVSKSEASSCSPQTARSAAMLTGVSLSAKGSPVQTSLFDIAPQQATAQETQANSPQPTKAAGQAQLSMLASLIPPPHTLPGTLPDPLSDTAQNAQQAAHGCANMHSSSIGIGTSSPPPAVDPVTEKEAFNPIRLCQDLPLMGTTLAILPYQEHLLLASAHWQRVYTGELPALINFLQEKSIPLIGADIKTLEKAVPNWHQLPIARWFDVSLAAHLMSPEERNYSFIALAERYKPVCGSPYTAETTPALLLLDLHSFFQKKLIELGLHPVFHDLEMPLIVVLRAMEMRGIKLDKQVFASFLEEVETELEVLTQKIHIHATKEFNIRSSQQLGDILFTTLALPKAGKTKGGAVSTSQESLEKLRGKHPIIEDILAFRTLEKLRSTYLDPLPKLTDNNGLLHTTFNQMATATGRLSSSNPNLQNIPVRGVFGPRMRRCFIATPNQLLVCADYSQIELRILAHLSQDPTLLAAFRNNEDIHARTAGLLFDVPLEHVTTEQRRNAKTINFGIIYGMGPQKLGVELGISMKEAKEFIERYFSRFAKLKQFYEEVETQAKTHGFVATMAGRRRLTPDLLSANKMLQSQARRQAINTRIQGSAADIIKLAMLAVENDEELMHLNAKLLLQIHDELLLEAPANNAAQALQRLTKIMNDTSPENAPLSVPLLVDGGIGPTWGDVK